MSNETIDVQATAVPAQPAQSQAVAIRQSMAVGQAMGVQEILAQVKLIQEVMRSVMTEGEHYGTIPGCGDKKTLLQPGAQKLTMTFRLAPEYQIQETDLERGHKEYRVVCTLKSITTGAFVGQGVGCCSSMESKYRYRGGARKCPQCGKEAIIMGKKFKPSDPEPGWLCWKKKDGCGATWPKGAPEIESQSTEKVENENPADTFNTVLKIAKKRAFVDATITATAASDIFTQDIGDEEGDEPEKPETAANAPRNDFKAQGATNTPPRGQSPQAQSPVKPAPAKKEPLPPADEQTRAKMIRKLDPMLDLATEYFRKLVNPAVILDTENLEDIPLQFVPVTVGQMKALEAAITDFGNGAEARHAYPPNGSQPVPSQPKPPPSVESAKQKDPEWWRKVIVPIPYKGQKRDDYMKSPETVGQLYDRRHEEGVNRRLFGFINHFEVQKTWVNGQGQTVMRSQSQVDTDTLFREALDACNEYHDKHGQDTQKQEPEEDDVPM